MKSENAQEYIDQNYPKVKRDQITELDIRNKTLEGHLDLNDFVNLRKLDCSNERVIQTDKSSWDSYQLRNELTGLDVSNCWQLTELNCSLNQLSNLNISKNTELTKLYCDSNNLSNLDVSENVNLIELRCSHNRLNNLNISNNKELNTLGCAGNRLINLDVSKNIKLARLDGSLNKISYLDLSNCLDLTELIFYDNELINCDISRNMNLTKIKFLYCKITRLDLSNCLDLIELDCHGNELISLDISTCNRLCELTCSKNQLTSLDISCCPQLTKLDCSGNLLDNLNFKSFHINTLTYLAMGNNKFARDLSCFSSLVNLKTLNISNNSFFGSLQPLYNLIKLETLDISDTDVDSGLEYLSSISLEMIHCSTKERPGSKVSLIKQSLKPYKRIKVYESFQGDTIIGYYDFQEWRKSNYSLIERTRKVIELEQEIQQLRSQLREAENRRSIEKVEIKKLKVNNLTSQIQMQKIKLGRLSKAKLNSNSQELWEIFCEAQEEIAKNSDNSFANKQLARAKIGLSKKINETELRVIFDRQAKIRELDNHLQEVTSSN